MKTTEERPDSIENASLDRLVDGDLPESERRDLLLRLENDPDGWRRCALAFLEDQSWRKALAPVASTPVPVPCPTSPNAGLPGKSWLPRITIAASLMASTFAAGFAAGGLTKVDHRVEVADSNLPKPAPTPTPTPSASQPDEIREVGSLQLVDGSAGESRPERFLIHAARRPGRSMASKRVPPRSPGGLRPGPSGSVRVTRSTSVGSW